MTPGYHGKYLRIDLSTLFIDFPPIPIGVISDCIGGVGLGAWILTRETISGYDPLGNQAALIFALSPLVGTPLTTSAKFAVIAKSPLTNRICDAMCSSHFAIAAKKLGVDAICITGKSDKPCILFMDSLGQDNVSIRLVSADSYWGQSASETESSIRSDQGTEWQILSIGKAGEMQIPFATLSHDGRHAGRGGLGAVMGSKNIKAIAVRGDKRTIISDPEATIRIAKSLSQRSFSPATAKYRELGTVANLLVFNRFESLPTRNFQEGSFQEAQELVKYDLAPARKITRNSCAACTIGCEHIYALDSKSGAAQKGVRMEYESLFALGPLCGVSNSHQVLEASSLCDFYGLDTISTGGTIAFLMECASRNLIQDDTLIRIKPEFGHGDTVIQLIHEMMSDMPGIYGELLRLGSRGASRQIEQGSIAFAQQVKGMEMPGYHPRKLHAMALGMAVGCRGADHNRTGAYEIDFRDHSPDASAIASSVIETEDKAAIMDSLILCKFIRGVFTDFYEEAADMLCAVTGLAHSRESLIASAKWIVNLRKSFNQREGWLPSEDCLPSSIFINSEDHENGLTQDRLEAMILHYNLGRGWSSEGFIVLDPNVIEQLIITENSF